MRKFVSILAVMMAIFSGVAVVYIRYEVNMKSDELKKMARQIEADKKSVHVLKAELAYLTSPSSLQEMSMQYLAMMPPKPEQIVISLSQVPKRPEGQQVKPAKASVIQMRHIRNKKKQERVGL